MNLLAAKVYDPSSSVSKSTASLLAMTALDTTNLRLPITVPAHGMVKFMLKGVVHGATTFPSILLGVMNGSTVLGRVAPCQSLGNTAVATALVNVWAEFVVTGLTPGAMNVDAAYGVETVVASTGLKYGGPNNTTANDAFGGFVFEAWDPQPQTANSTLAVDANGRVDLSKVLGSAINALVGGRMDSSVGAMANNVLTAAAVNAAALNGKGDWNIGKTGYALAAAEYTALVNAIWDELTSEGRTAGSYGQLLKDNVNATVSSRATQTSVDTIDDFLDTEIAAIKAKTDNLPLAPAATGDAMTLTVGERAAIADKLLNRNQQGGADTSPTVSQALASGLLKLEISGATLTAKHGDGTTAFTRTITRQELDAIVSLV